jgi:hypothetical protein
MKINLSSLVVFQSIAGRLYNPINSSFRSSKDDNPCDDLLRLRQSRSGESGCGSL